MGSAKLKLGSPSLNAEQECFVKSDANFSYLDGPPGTGKTTTIVEKVRYNILNRNLNPKNILLTTFSKDAQLKLRDDLSKALPEFANDIEVRTLHSFCWHVISDNATYFNFDDKMVFEINDDFSDLIKSLPVVKEGLDKKEIDAKELPTLIRYLQFCYADGKDPSSEESGFDSSIGIDFDELMDEIDNKTINEKEGTFDDLIRIMQRALKGDPDFRLKIGSKYDLITADECQDLSRVQLEVLYYLYSINEKLILVGDLNQMLYEFRYVDVNFIQELIKDAKVFRLTKSHRFHQGIAVLLNSVISSPNPIVSALPIKGPQPKCMVFKNIHQEAQWIANQVETLIKEGYQASDIAVLFRCNKGIIQKELPYLLAEKGISCQLTNSKEHFIKDTMFDLIDPYYKLLSRKSDSKSFAKLLPLIYDDDQREFEFDDPIPYNWLYENIKQKYHDKLDDLIAVSGDAQKYPDDAISCFHELLDLCKWYHGHPLRNRNWQFLFGLAPHVVHRVIGVLRHNTGIGPNTVHMSTIHKAKGREWRAVFIPQLIEGTLPFSKSIREGTIESERRILYVALSRPKERCYLSFSKDHSIKSQFLTDDVMSHLDLVHCS